jgi:hypothetical protein
MLAYFIGGCEDMTKHHVHHEDPPAVVVFTTYAGYYMHQHFYRLEAIASVPCSSEQVWIYVYDFACFGG